MPARSRPSFHLKKSIRTRSRTTLCAGLLLTMFTAGSPDSDAAPAAIDLLSEIRTRVMGTRTVSSKNQRTTAATTNSEKKAASTTRLPAATQSLPNDPHVPDQWSFMAPDLFPGAANIFNTPLHNSSQSQIVVAVVDSGLLLDHEDYIALPGYDFVHDPLVGNDGDGRDSDPTDPGDWVSNADTSTDQVATNCPVTHSKWHGTAIAGVIGAQADNRLGIAGAASFVSLLPVRVTGKCGGYVNDLIDGIRWAAGLSVAGVPDNTNPARIINLSVGFPGNCNSRLQAAIDEATDAGAILVTAATNNGVLLDNHPYSPATCNNVLAIGATLRNGFTADYSAYGKALFLLAPGGSAKDGIVSTDNAGLEHALQQSSYGYHYGTSLAAAHVSAALARLLSIDPALSNTELENLLSNSASLNSNDPKCNNGACGSGQLNTNDAINMLLYPHSNIEFSDAESNLPIVAAAQAPADSTSAIGSISHNSLWVFLFLLVGRLLAMPKVVSSGHNTTSRTHTPDCH